MQLHVFALKSSHAFGAQTARALGVALSAHEERQFEDGEHKARPLVDVRDGDVYVIGSLHGGPEQSPNDKLCRLLFFLGAVRDAGAARVTAVVPYLCYARKDRRTKSRDPVTNRYVAALFEAVGIDRVVSIDVHNPVAYENAFRVPAEHLEARHLFVPHFARLLAGRQVVVVSPDAGGVKRAERFRQSLEAALSTSVGSAFMEKHRSEGVVRGEAFVGDVAGKVAIVIDDLVASGTTLARAAAACRARDAQQVFAAATHGLFVDDASGVLAASPLDRLVITNTVPPFRLDPVLCERQVTVLDAASLFAEAIRRLHAGESLVELSEA
jgi:ribose-phosphate pyrophosphokinase